MASSTARKRSNARMWRRLAAAVPSDRTPRPNFVFILGEGHGWSSTSVQMDDRAPRSKSAFVRTPSLEKLAEAGMRFANFYAPSPRCTPSRATFFTGVSPAQLHRTFVGEGKGDTGGADAGRKVIPPRCLLELPEQTTSIAELLKSAGRSIRNCRTTLPAKGATPAPRPWPRSRNGAATSASRTSRRRQPIWTSTSPKTPANAATWRRKCPTKPRNSTAG